MKKIISSLYILLSVSLYSQQNTYEPPINIPLELSANFGELRPNHFHTGIDIKTQKVINKPVFSIEDGYISRISISPSGYGLALYINHPSTGQTSLYGHLNKFTPELNKYVKDKQYEKETYKIEIYPEINEFPVKKGDLVAYSGNTGSSGGPHVHFEIRDTKTDHALDPLSYYGDRIPDKKAPEIRGISIYPIAGKGSVNNSNNVYRQVLAIQKDGKYCPLAKPITAWGTIGFGINAVDKMDNTYNTYGVKSVRLYCDEELISSFNINEVDFDQSKIINSMTDFDYWHKNKKFYMKSFIEPGNTLPIYDSTSSKGYLDINEAKTYKLRYELIDNNGNKTLYNFSIIGKKQEIPLQDGCAQAMIWNHNNYYITDDFTLTIPANTLYDNICFLLQKRKSNNFSSQIYSVNNQIYIPLNGTATLKVKMTKDSLENKKQYGIVSIDNKKIRWIGGEYSDGYITAQIKELGADYAVSYDTKAPSITPLQPLKWKQKSEIIIKVTDNLSGIKSCRGTLNGEYALFENDIKSANYIYKLDSERLEKGKKYQLEFTAEDACGNSSSYKYEFTY